MASINFETERKTRTQYQIAAPWDIAFMQWWKSVDEERNWSLIAILTDEHIWAIYGDRVRATLASLNRRIVTLILPSGEDSKEFEVLSGLVDILKENRVHRRDLLICLGGGVCCDIGGLLALLYMRGIDYVNLPTSLMAQIDAAIGGKVGANFRLRKNLLGGFHHPLMVLIDPTFLDTLPQIHFRTALAEALKVAIVRQDERLLELLEKCSEALLNRERGVLLEVIELCIKGKLELLISDPYENDLNRALNFGHAVGHALERLPVMEGQRQPLHGEAVSLGIAAAVRYGFRTGICSRNRALHLLSILFRLGLPLTPDSADRQRIKDQLSSIPEHRGGLFRLVVPTDETGISILPSADLDILVDCLFPITELHL
jgi:3-dehydroquinate synthase